ncbi:MAG TPA: hypothetical protein VFN61_12215 [Acidimicrobiales bacterium]|nr:hypothetical protein [Acidimicrobiales bacterium]
MQDSVFGATTSSARADALVARVANDGTQVWGARAGSAFVGAGRVDFVPGTAFAGMWGGAVVETWRGKGIYRAITAARARAALTAGKTYIQSDCTEYSRPILDCSGLVKVSTTTPYTWHLLLP